MIKSSHLRTALLLTVSSFLGSAFAAAEPFNIPAGDLASALDAYTAQTGIGLIVSSDAVKGARTAGARGDVPASVALAKILAGTGFVERKEDAAIAIVRSSPSSEARERLITDLQLAQAAPVSRSSVETVTVTSSKLGGADVQSVPIAITALSQEQLTSSQTNGGPDLVKQVPNLTFSKTNFTGYNIQIRGIGTQAISVTTDPAVAVAFNDTPFIRNHFFEQEFYDVGQLEVLRGPQGTLYGRNATAGVVNMVSARPTDQFEAMISGDVGNYKSRRLEGMLNIPIVDDRLDLRIAGEWTKRDGYILNETTGEQVDGRNLWSGRVTLGMKPSERFQAYLIWEHFSEDDDRERSTKQLCNRDPGPTQVGPFNQSFVALGGILGGPSDISVQVNKGDILDISSERSARGALSQGCLPASLYSPESYQTPNGAALPIVYAAQTIYDPSKGTLILGEDPYASETQSRNLRAIQSQIKPLYKAKNDIVEFMMDYDVTPSLKLTSQTGFNHDFLASTEDFNRFNSNPGLFFSSADQINSGGWGNGGFGVRFTPGGVMCDPQLGCSDRFVGEDLSQEHAWQISQEVRLASNFTGPLNFSVGANYLHYETLEDYYVFLNVLTLISRYQDEGATLPATVNGACLSGPQSQVYTPIGSNSVLNCPYTDPTPLTAGFNGQGHNYFRSTNPYVLSSYAGFGEAYYQVFNDLKLTGGLRWTDDQKHFVEIPSEVLASGWGYPVSGVVDQEWKEVTGRAVINWTPKLDFTDQTLVYASFSRGYKAGGANPPVPNPLLGFQVPPPISVDSVTHPATFAPEFVNAFELGTKDTLLDGALTVNGDVFYYDYKGYQISQIVDRSSINLNFNARVRGAEIETTYEPVPGLRFNFSGGWEDTRLANGSRAIDLMDRTAGHTDWLVVKPSVFSTSNCILPQYVVAELVEMGLTTTVGYGDFFEGGKYISSITTGYACEWAYNLHEDPVIAASGGITPVNPERVFPPSGFDPTTAPNNGEGFDKDLSGNQLPNAPPLTASFGAQYSMPLTPDWAGTIRADYYWQDYSWARVFNDRPYDRLRGYTNVNLTFILTNQNGWQAMAYAKNLFNTTAITGAFLNSDDTALTTNVFTTDPRLIGVRVTKNW